ncbi:MAG: hypothetical protein WD534_16585 [Phycisphaeraceae bacterium]
MDGPTQKPKANWLALLRNSGEADLGAAMIRLAKLAAATHQVEADLEASDAEAMTRLNDVRELQGRSSGLVARTGACDHAGPFRKEVER